MWCSQDDGCGIGALAEAMQRGIGLVGLRERAWAHGATLEIASSDSGSTFSATFPLAATNA